MNPLKKIRSLNCLKLPACRCIPFLLLIALIFLGILLFQGGLCFRPLRTLLDQSSQSMVQQDPTVQCPVHRNLNGLWESGGH